MESIQLTKEYIATLLNVRSENSHKGMYGHALLIAGNQCKMGAAVIAGKACLRSGVGLLTINVPYEERLIVQTAIPEAMLQLREESITDFSRFSAIGIGPGLGISEKEEKLLGHILSVYKEPIVFDADALTVFSNKPYFLMDVPVESIFTPHPKEFDRLFGEHKDQDARKLTAITKAKEYRIIIVLKGHETFITNGEESFINTTGNAGLAKGGSGDALTGMITAFLAQRYHPFTAAKLGVYLHGLAADIAVEKQSEESLLISDVIEALGEAFRRITNPAERRVTNTAERRSEEGDKRNII